MGIQESKDVLVAVNELSLGVIKVVKDGVQPVQDVAGLIAALQQEPLKSSLSLAIQNISAVPSEIKDVDLSEGVELAAVQLSYIPKIVQALKG